MQNILKGERAILLDLDTVNKREERNKLLRFNNNLSAVEALKQERMIEMSTS